MQKKAVVLLNMGGPNNLDEVKVFLHNMFNDKNIITVKSDFLRSFIAFMIVTSRSKAAKKNYSQIGGKSPIVGYTKALVAKLQKEFDDTFITFAMRYTPPFGDEALAQIQEKGIKEVFLLPLYPHFSTTTTKSSLEDFRTLMRSKKMDLKLSSIKRFFGNERYNELLIQRILEALGDQDPKDFTLICSAHSLPQKIVDKGDPYQREILLHVEHIKAMLQAKKIVFQGVHVAYQSKLGPVKWLEPSLEEKLKSLTCKKVLIAPLSFTIDNSETEFELDIEYREVAHALGYEEYRVAKCPNDADAFVAMLKEIIVHS
ncbi:MAG: ferrochelatase [Sulfurospirillum sp.]|nr:ferrochelatase [Sulfurospirillum sp.]